MKSDTIGNRTRDLPECSAVPQSHKPPRTPIGTKTTSNMTNRRFSQWYCWRFDFFRVRALSLGDQLQTFQRNVVYSPSRSRHNFRDVKIQETWIFINTILRTSNLHKRRSFHNSDWQSNLAATVLHHRKFRYVCNIDCSL